MRQAILGVLTVFAVLSMVIAAGEPKGSDNSAGDLLTRGDGEKPEVTTQNNESNMGEDDRLRKEIRVENEERRETGPGEGNGQLISPNGGQNNSGQETAQAVKSRIEEKQAEMDKELENLTGEKRQNLKNQNTIRLAVHALLAVENRTGGIGQNISVIAREFNNSINKTVQAEEKIQTRNSVARFLFGGDENAAKEIENETARNQERINELKKLIQDCECDEETKLLLREQVTALEEEQARLSQVAEKEKSEKGVFGWLWK